MAWKIEISGQAARMLREAAKNGGWIVDADDEIPLAELVSAGLVYDGAVTGDGYGWLKQK